MVKFRVYFARKLGKALFLMVGVSIIVFALYKYLCGPVLIDFSDMNLVKLYLRRISYIWDKPFIIGYFYYINDLVHGDWGFSVVDDFEPLWGAIVARLPITLGLSIVALTLMICMGVPLGILSALKEERKMGNVLKFIIQLCSSVPVFFLAILLPYIFYFKFSSWRLPHLPLSGYSSLIYFILPIITIAVGGIGIMARYVREAARKVFEEDYIKTVEIKGLSKISIIKHALMNIFLFPQSSLISILSMLLIGIIFAETLFGLPGLGFFFVRSLLIWDMDTIFGLMLFFSFAFIVVVLFADILRYFLDPRIRYPPTSESSLIR